MLLSVLPLATMVEPRGESVATQVASTPLSVAWKNQALRRLVAYGVVLSLVNGLTQAAQGIYPVRAVGLDFLWLMGFRSVMYLGQSASGPYIGWLADRFGNRPLLIVSQMFVALGPLFYFLASAEHTWILGFAFVAWIAYAGINVAQPALLLRLSPSRDAASEVSIYYAFSGLAYGLGSLAGGISFDLLTEAHWSWSVGSETFDVYDLFFLGGTLARLLSVVLLVRLIEPSAVRLRDVFTAAARQNKC
jgi:MFS family permease